MAATICCWRGSAMVSTSAPTRLCEPRSSFRNVVRPLALSASSVRRPSSGDGSRVIRPASAILRGDGSN